MGELAREVSKWLTDDLLEDDMLSPSVDNDSRLTDVDIASSSSIGGSSAEFSTDGAVSGWVECSAATERIRPAEV